MIPTFRTREQIVKKSSSFVAMLCSSHSVTNVQVAIEISGEKSKGSHNACPNNQLCSESEVTIMFHL